MVFFYGIIYKLYGSLVKRLRLRPLTPATRVRFPHESPPIMPGKRDVFWVFCCFIGFFIPFLKIAENGIKAYHSVQKSSTVRVR